MPSNDNSRNETAAKPKIHYVTKKISQKELANAESKEKVLAKEKDKKEAEYKKLTAVLKTDKAKAKKEKAAAVKETDNQTAANNSSTNSGSEEHHYHHANNSYGNMNTAKTGRIVGNRNSKIYHLPGQAGYRMSSKNAVYFDSEAQAQAAGYRKAKR